MTVFPGWPYMIIGSLVLLKACMWQSFIELPYMTVGLSVEIMLYDTLNNLNLLTCSYKLFYNRKFSYSSSCLYFVSSYIAIWTTCNGLRSIGNIWEFLPGHRLPCLRAYWSAFCFNPSGIWRASCWYVICNYMMHNISYSKKTDCTFNTNILAV